MNAQLRIGLARNPSAPDPDDYDDRLRSWLDQMDAAEFGMWARDFFDLQRNAAHYDAFRDQMQATFDRVCGGAA